MAGKTTKASINKDKLNPTDNITKNIPTEAEPRLEDAVEEKTEKTVSYKERPKLSPNTVVTVKHGFNGRLVYRSKKSGDKYVWEEYGDEQEFDLQELKNAKNSSKAFFINNWFMIDDPEVISYLGVEQYYKNALDCDELLDLIDNEPEKIGEAIEKLSYGQKESVKFFARRLVGEGSIDSVKAIKALEDALNIELSER